MPQLPIILREALSGHDTLQDAAAVRRAAERSDPALLQALLSSAELRGRLFVDVGGVVVLDRAALWDLLDDAVNDGGSAPPAPVRMLNVRRHTADGVEVVSIGEDRLVEGNLLIKGENLQALTILLPALRERVKLAYIDPPYNTGSGSFLYEDRLSRSAWLAFMRERVELARLLLRPDGVLAIQCSFHHAAHLEVMLDQVEGLHKVMVFHVLVRHPDRALTADKQFNDVMEHVFIYARDPRFRMPRRRRPRQLDEYRWQVELTGPGLPLELGGRACTVYRRDEWAKRAVEPGAENLRTHSIRGSLREKNSSGRFYVAHIEPLAARLGPFTLVRVPGIGDDGRGHRFFHTPQAGNRNGSYFQGVPQSTDATELPYPNFLDFHAEYNRVAAEGGVDFRNGKKPEALLRFLVELFTAPGDLVLDYHLGSGTAAAVAHKLGRRWVGVEKMDFIGTVTLRRLRGVLGGERSGISPEIGWVGGGEFIYLELG